MRLSRLVAVPVLVALGMAAPALARAGDTRTTVAVLYFDYDGKATDMEFLRKGLNEMLVADLTGTPGIAIIERARLEEVLGELELQRTTKIDRTSAVRVGKLLGARYLVMGSYFDFKEELHVSIKVVNVETGEVTAAVRDRRKVDEFWELEQHLGAELAKVMKERIAPKTPEASARAAPEARSGKAQGNKTKDKTRSGSKSSRAEPRVRQVEPKLKKLHARTAARYGRALDAMDRGDRQTAGKELKAVIKEAPDFEMAILDLAALAR